MASEPDQNDRRAEVKRLFRHLQRVRADKETIEHARTVDLCRPAAETLEPGKEQKQAVYFQEHAIRDAREAARQTEAHGWHEAPRPDAETRSGPKPGPRHGPLGVELRENLAVRDLPGEPRHDGAKRLPMLVRASNHRAKV